MKARAGIVRVATATTAVREDRARQVAAVRRRRAIAVGRGRTVRREATARVARARVGPGPVGIVDAGIVRKVDGRRIAGMSHARCARLRRRS